MTRVSLGAYRLTQLDGSLVVHVSGPGMDDRRVIGYKLKTGMPDDEISRIIIAVGKPKEKS